MAQRTDKARLCTVRTENRLSRASIMFTTFSNPTASENKHFCLTRLCCKRHYRATQALFGNKTQNLVPLMQGITGHPRLRVPLSSPKARYTPNLRFDCNQKKYAMAYQARFIPAVRPKIHRGSTWHCYAAWADFGKVLSMNLPTQEVFDWRMSPCLVANFRRNRCSVSITCC